MALVSIFRPTSHLPSQLCSPRCAAFWMAHLALSVALATMVLAMSSMTVAMATGRRWGVGLGSSENFISLSISRLPAVGPSSYSGHLAIGTIADPIVTSAVTLPLMLPT